MTDLEATLKKILHTQEQILEEVRGKKEDFLTREEAAALMGVSEQTITYYVRCYKDGKGGLKNWGTAHRQKFLKADVLALKKKEKPVKK